MAGPIGVSLFGRIDIAPGASHVATRFAHVLWIPIVPLGSYVLAGDDDRGDRVPIPLDARSVTVAWVEGASIVCAAVVATPLVVGAFTSDTWTHRAGCFGLVAAIGAGVALARRLSGHLFLASRRQASRNLRLLALGDLELDELTTG